VLSLPLPQCNNLNHCFPVSANPVQGLPPADRLRTRPLMKTRLDRDPIKLFFDVRFKFLHRRI
jgi:hypothetical protein